nr:AAC_HP1_G0006780.mRNA.1.CDS.1 [Saccharomyces cerevisiae]
MMDILNTQQQKAAEGGRVLAPHTISSKLVKRLSSHSSHKLSRSDLKALGGSETISDGPSQLTLRTDTFSMNRYT